ncbi:molybdate transport system ATP-binding protein [Terracoccus luteus]|uniref:Molybdate transport system ATP-binding protein n=2 Tax=Terracoccus luteus TaxID=53356 RepID=A0A839PV19_9MICO|nr:ATP-binding cassette domain-containing protein [Terracoccus luteus]MBB2987970.1 molybdate transport system ATP-binding protein [Terracoccus luteus]MCP2173621.1 molybdate transport system ATP-binding protein [Terracoccus luteus]
MSAVVDARGVDVALDVAAGERVAVLGPNGAGKSTLLAVLAGVLRPDAGEAVLDDRVLYRQGGPDARWVPPHARGIALLAQDPLLFPHLTALDNVAFGPRSAGARPRAAREEARRWLAEVDAEGLAGRRPAQLSGGQQQRVAVARALAARPRLLLLDEPMAALDVAAAPMLRRVLARVLAHRAAVIVTHDLLDAVLLSTRVVVVDHGRVVESGPTAEVVARPRTPFMARLAGLDLVRGTAVDATHLRDDAGRLVEGVASGDLVAGAPALAVFSPTAVAVHVAAPSGSPRNTFAAVVVELEPRDAQVRVRAHDERGGVLLADVTAASVGELDLHPGRSVHLAVKATAVTLYPA